MTYIGRRVLFALPIAFSAFLLGVADGGLASRSDSSSFAFPLSLDLTVEFRRALFPFGLGVVVDKSNMSSPSEPESRSCNQSLNYQG